MDALDDEEAVAAILAGEVNAYAALVLRYQRPIFNLMCRMTGSQEDARDLAQETFIKAYEKLSYFQTGKRFFPWLYAIGLNHARNFLRKNKSSKGLNQDIWGYPSESDSPGGEEERLCLRLDSQKLKQALQEIPLGYREALILYYHEELPMEAVATALSLSLSGAKMRVHRGLKKLRGILFEDHDEKDRSTSKAR
jgi:RNA polymerase sigma-70 factor (ECF subfamily)